MFSVNPSNITQTQRYGRRTRASVVTGGVAAVALLIGASNFAKAAEISPRMAQEQHACTVMLGLHQPGDLYDTCMRSLNKTLSELDQARLASTQQSACADQGLEPGTTAFGLCVVNEEQSPADAGHYPVNVSLR
jgi:hypothetical protein